MSNEPWNRFQTAAMDLVRQGQHIKTLDPYIHMLFEPALGDDPTHIQLYWKSNTVKWFKTTWLKNAETYDFSVVGSLKYLHDTPNLQVISDMLLELDLS